MARHKDAEWNVPASVETWEQAQVAVLMDLRDELRELNALLHCQSFQRIPAKLDRIGRNTEKRRKTR